jgi:hypothetical protein
MSALIFHTLFHTPHKDIHTLRAVVAPQTYLAFSGTESRLARAESTAGGTDEDDDVAFEEDICFAVFCAIVLRAER